MTLSSYLKRKRRQTVLLNHQIMAVPPIHIDGETSLLPYKSIATFPVGSFLENLAVRSNGTLLISSMLVGEIYYLDPNASDPQATIRKVHTFVTERAIGSSAGEEDKGGSYGSNAMAMAIVEDSQHQDIFYALSGLHGRENSWAVWELDLRHFDPNNAESTAKVTKRWAVPQAKWLNGGTMIPQTSTLLIAECLDGKLFSVDVRTGKVGVWLDHELLGKFTDRAPWPGVNGVHFFRNWIYMMNSDRALILRAAVDVSTGEYVPNSIEVVAENCTGDDFAFDRQGNLYMTTHPAQTVQIFVGAGLGKRGEAVKRLTIVGGKEQAETAGPTAAAFGRTARDRSGLYVTTDGGIVQPVGGEIGLGRIIRVDVGIDGETQ